MLNDYFGGVGIFKFCFFKCIIWYLWGCVEKLLVILVMFLLYCISFVENILIGWDIRFILINNFFFGMFN